MEKEIETIKRLPLKDVFGTEDGGFTPWLAANLDRLTDITGIPLASPRTEVALNTLRPDIIAYTDPDDGDEVIIENQYGKSDSFHIGKLLSYAAYEKKARYAILITENARDEHRAAVEALNQYKVCGCKFFLVKAACYQIGDSNPAIAFDLEVGEPATVGQTEKEASLSKWWSLFIKTAEKKNVAMFAKLKHGEGRNPNNWLYAYIGKANAHFVAKVTKTNASVYFLLDAQDDALNAQRYAALYKHHEEINAKFGSSLEWVGDTERKSCKIECTIDDKGGYGDAANWQGLAERMLDVVRAMNEALSPYYKLL